MDNAEEIRKILEQTQNGHWMPISIILGLFAVIGGLVYATYKRDNKEQKSASFNTNKLLSKLTDSVTVMEKLLVKIETVQEHHDERINNCEFDIKQIVQIKATEDAMHFKKNGK